MGRKISQEALRKHKEESLKTLEIPKFNLKQIN